MCKEPQSWLGAENMQSTERFISQMRSSDVKRRALQSMALIEREVTRQPKREHVRTSTNISYAFDERDGHMLLRYRCDVDPLGRQAHCSTAWGRAQVDGISEREAMELCHTKGVIGVGRQYYEKTLEMLTEAGALQLVEDVLSLIRAFCTPLGDTFDAHLFEIMKNKAISLAVDGAALKAAQILLERHMPNAIIIYRDASHAIRIACKEPLIRSGGFEKQYEELFKKKNALLKKIDYSNKLKAELEVCQKHVVTTEGSQGGGLTSIIRNMSHAPQRWESMSAPYRTYCCIFKAVAMMLAAVCDSDQDCVPHLDLVYRLSYLVKRPPCIPPFLHSPIHPAIHSSIHPRIHSSIHSFIHSFLRSFIHSFIRSSIHSVIHSFINPSYRAFAQSLSHSHTCAQVRMDYLKASPLPPAPLLPIGC